MKVAIIDLVTVLSIAIVMLAIATSETTICEDPVTEVTNVANTNEVVSVEEQEEATNHVYELSDEEFLYCCRVVATEAGGESYEGKLAVAQTIKNRMETRNQTIMQVMKAKNQYAYYSNVNVDNETVEAVRNCFLHNENAVDEIITHFYAYNLINAPSWATEDCYVTTIGCHRFYGRY